MPADTWRTVLFFEEGAPVCAGAPAIDRFAEREGDGRLVQSIKSHLASAVFTRTIILGRTYTLEALIAAYLRALRGAVGAELGARAVVGRPVRYWGARDQADEDAGPRPACAPPWRWPASRRSCSNTSPSPPPSATPPPSTTTS